MRRNFARRAVKRFMPGEELSDALQATRELAPDKIGVIITRLGESLTGESQADGVRDHYLGAYDQIARDRLNAVVSVKPTQLGLDHSYDTCLGHMMALAGRAEETGSEFWIDMEDSSYVDRTLDLYRAVKAKHDRTGLAIQAYLRRTPDDIEKLIAVRPMVRLVKGAYSEPADVAYPAKKDVDKAFVSIGERLLKASAEGNATTILGTHDLTIVQHLIGRAREWKVQPGAYQVHMLYGIRMAEQRRLAASGECVRCLISYGSQWFPWYMRRLAERPANAWFVMKSAFMR